jgi:hypothetical protein
MISAAKGRARRRGPARAGISVFMDHRDKPGDDVLICGGQMHSSTAVYMLASRRHGTIYDGLFAETPNPEFEPYPNR